MFADLPFVSTPDRVKSRLVLGNLKSKLTCDTALYIHWATFREIEALVKNPVIFSFYRAVARSALGFLLTMRIHCKGVFSIGLIVLLMILWQLLWFRWATLW
jgi:hypothetical protein